MLFDSLSKLVALVAALQQAQVLEVVLGVGILALLAAPWPDVAAVAARGARPLRLGRQPHAEPRGELVGLAVVEERHRPVGERSAILQLQRVPAVRHHGVPSTAPDHSRRRGTRG